MFIFRIMTIFYYVVKIFHNALINSIRLVRNQQRLLLLIKKVMQESEQQIMAIKQFITVVNGVRIHGQLYLTKQNENQLEEHVFILKLQSNLHKMLNQEIFFDNQALEKYGLKQSFKSVQVFYDYVSKMTKKKVKFDTQNYALIILQNKDKTITQHQISLARTQPKIQNVFEQKQNKVTMKKEKQQQNYERKESNTKQCSEKQKEQKSINQVKDNQHKHEQNQQIFEHQQQQKIFKKIQEQQHKDQPLQPQKCLKDKLQNQKQFQQETNFTSFKENQIDQNILTQKQIAPKQQLKHSIQNQTKLELTHSQTKQSVSLNDAQSLNSDAIVQLQKFLGYNTQAQIQNQSYHKPQNNPISQKINKNQPQNLTLYEFSVKFQLQTLKNIIETQELQKVQQIVLKRSKPITQIPPFHLITLQNLTSLTIEENKIQQISNLITMVNLQKLHLQANSIFRIQGLNHFKNLKVLKLGNNKITKIQGLQTLTSLETLWLDFNSISKIQGLHKLKSLKSLNLSFNEISKIEGLDSLINLQELLINENQLNQIENLSQLTKLTRLSLNSNLIKEIKGLKKLLLLEVVYLSGNMIEHFGKSAFDEINWLKMLKQLRINGNQIQWEQQSKKYLQRLKNYSVKVKV